MSKRNPELIFLIGENGTGKTTYAKHLLKLSSRSLIIPANASDSRKSWGHVPALPVDAILKKVTGFGPLDWELLEKDKHRDKRHALMFYFARIFRAIKGAYKIEIPNRRKILFEFIIHDELGFKNGYIHFDDFKNYCPSYNPPTAVIQFLADRRHKQLDISLAAHAPNEIPAFFYGKGPRLVLWKTGRSFKSAKTKIAPAIYEELEKAQARINAKPKATPTNGRPVISPYEVIQLPEQEE